MKNDPVIVQCIINASVQEVWKALTENVQMKNWYFDIEDFQPKTGFEFNFTAGTEQKKYVHQCKITKVIPERTLAHTWRFEGYPGDSVVNFEMFPEESGTNIKVTHYGLETFPSTPEFSKESFANGWSQIICSNLKNYVENKSAEKMKE